MATIGAKSLETIRRFYFKDGLSAREIAEKLEVSLDAVYYFFRKYDIPRRSASEISRLQFARKPLSFSVKNNLTLYEKKLKVAGIMLYWAEGSNWSGGTVVDFANSDSGMILIFLEFLRKICGVDERRLRVYLYCYSNQKPSQLIKYWSKITEIPQGQFTKPYVRKDYRPEKINKMPYGLIHIRYADKKLLLLIKKWINSIIKDLRVDGGVVKRTGL